MCTSTNFLKSYKFLINLGYCFKYFPFYVILTNHGIRLKPGNLIDILQSYIIISFHFLFKIICIYILGIYIELTDKTLETNERIQYYFVVSCETMALLCICFNMFYAERMRGLFDTSFLFQAKISKYKFLNIFKY